MNNVSTVSWVMVDDHNPSFNLWEAVCKNGNRYKETFRKDEDPNGELHYGHFGKKVEHVVKNKRHTNSSTVSPLFQLTQKQFRTNAYTYAMKQRDIKHADMAKELGLSMDKFRNKIHGYTYFTRAELTKLNKLLGYESRGSRDVRMIVAPELWSHSRSGAYEESEAYIRGNKNKGGRKNES